MAFTRVVGPGIHTQSNIDSHNIHSSGIITAVSFVGDGSGLTGVASTDNIITGTAATFTGGVNINDLSVTGNVTIGGTLTYEDVKNVDSIGIITARSGIDVDDFLDVGSNIQLGNAGVATATLFSGASQIGIQSAGTQIGAGITQLNFIGAGNTFAVSGTTVAISIAGGGGGSGAFTTSVTGIQTTSQIVGIGTTSTDDADLQGIGNSARGMYVSNGMIIMDNAVSGNHYIGTNFNALMVGPVNLSGTISIDGNYVVV